MPNNHQNASRLIARTGEELSATRQIADKMGWKAAYKTFIAKIDIQMLSRFHVPESKRKRRHLMAKHDVMLAYFRSEFSEFLNQYDYSSIDLLPCDYPCVIWTCWWQGLEDAPEIVKACIQSMKKNAGNTEVVVIDESNYEQYVYIPDWLKKKHADGVISRTHFSDVLRIALLSQHGGVWLDSTFFCSSEFSQDCINMPLFTIKRPGYGHASVACGQFANYSLGCDKDHRWVFGVVRDMLYDYWRRHDDLIDYLFLDYLIKILIDENKEIASLFCDIPSNNSRCDDLLPVLSRSFDGAYWEEMCSDTSLFKLTWKCDYQSLGQETFYGKIVSGELL